MTLERGRNLLEMQSCIGQGYNHNSSNLDKYLSPSRLYGIDRGLNCSDSTLALCLVTSVQQ